MKQPQLHYYDISDAVTAFSSTRHGGVSEGSYGEFNINGYCGDTPEHVQANRLALAEELGIGGDKIIMGHQVHGIEVRMISSELLSLSPAARQMVLEGVDVLMTDSKGICIGVSTADCIPVILYDPEHKASAVVHAGWRGTVQRVVHKAVQAMTMTYASRAEKLLAVIGPGISRDNFEVGEEVYDEFCNAGFDMDAIASFTSKWHIDLPLCNSMQLQENGLSADNITMSGICTYAAVDDFFSARRLGIESGRVFTGVVIR